MIARDIGYDFPESAYLILASFIWLLLFLGLSAYQKNALNHFASPNLLSSILVRRSSFYTGIKYSAFILTWICACIALMEPKAHSRYIHTDESFSSSTDNRQPPRSVLILIDASASMGVTDTRLGLSRLDDAKEVAQAIASLFAGSNIGVTAFTSLASQLSPPTPDQIFIQLMIKDIKINEGDVAGTDFLASLKSVHDLYFVKPSDIQYSLIIFSDGGDTSLSSLQGSQKNERIQTILNQLKPKEGVNLKVYTIGEGGQKGIQIPGIVYEGQPVLTELNSDFLQQLSKIGHGSSYLSNDYTTLALAEKIAKEILQTPYEANISSPSTKTDKDESLTFDVYFQYPLAFALLFLAVGIFWPETNVRRKGGLDA